MSIERVTLSPSDENVSPPDHEIEISVIGNDVFITVYDGSLDDLTEGRKKVCDVPSISLHELIAALNAFSDASVGIRCVRPVSTRTEKETR